MIRETSINTNAEVCWIEINGERVLEHRDVEFVSKIYDYLVGNRRRDFSTQCMIADDLQRRFGEEPEIGMSTTDDKRASDLMVSILRDVARVASETGTAPNHVSVTLEAWRILGFPDHVRSVVLSEHLEIHRHPIPSR